MTEIRAPFFIECEELLEAMQDGLQMMDDGTDDAETIHIVFRAVHSIKGGAGAFGLEGLVRFAHCYETVLDAVRGGTVSVDADLLKLFFRASDHVSDLVRACRDDTDLPVAQEEELVAAPEAYSTGAGEQAGDEAQIDFQPLSLDLNFDFDDAPEDKIEWSPHFEIYFAPDTEMFENGNDAPSILRALANLGKCEVVCDTTKLPLLDELAPEFSYLSWNIELVTDVDEAEIASIFEFVEGLCIYTISKSSAGVMDIAETGVDPLPDPASPEVPAINEIATGSPPQKRRAARRKRHAALQRPQTRRSPWCALILIASSGL